ncbi:hypothetical protein L1987_27711 [Smallanthus sonchifolius]|uniref:Uncharacterized protein n=1 Tax=Smallanthus sonchifolius TaxID=185202 RepID=A0ACB9ICJ4_9ASTR|nr:hypothetical protein L1987_27711 [Smallanthus sonchifolius]
MATVFQTIDDDFGTTTKPLKLQSASESFCEVPSVPMVPTAEAGGVVIPKDPSRYTVEETELKERDMRALGLLTMALPKEIYHYFNNYTSV